MASTSTTTVYVLLTHQTVNDFIIFSADSFNSSYRRPTSRIRTVAVVQRDVLKTVISVMMRKGMSDGQQTA